MAAADYYSQVQQAYIAYYGRPADPAGLIYWANQLNQAGGDLNQIINAFGNSAESTALYSSGNLYTELNQIYQTLFGRDADSAGANYYVEQIQTGKMTLASIALNVYNGAQGSDADALAAKLQFATAFTNDLLQSSTAAAAYGGDAAAGNARTALLGVTDSASAQTAINNLPTTIANIGTGAVTYLTAGADVVTGSNIVGSLTQYNTDGKGPTLNYNDVITGSTGGTNNTLTLNDDYSNANDVIPLGASISNIQNVVLQTAGNAGGSSAFDTSNISGVTNLTVKSAGNGEDNVKAAATTDINVSHLATSGSVVTAGGNNVTVNTAAGNVTIGSTGTANVNPAGAVNVTAANSGNVTVYGGTTVTVNDAGQNSTIQIGTNGSAVSASEPTGAVTVNATGTGSTVEVYGGTDVTVTSAGGNSDQNGYVRVGDIENNVVYAPTGNVTVNVNEAQAEQFNFGTGNYTGNYGEVDILGGANVSVTTNAGSVYVGGTSTNNGALIAGENPTGTVTVTDTAGAEDIQIYGGTDVNVTAAGDYVTIGNVNGSIVAAPTGTITVNNTASVAFNGISGINSYNEAVNVVGGTNVDITTNAGSVTVGTSAGTAGSEATGTINVTDSSNGSVSVYGGTDVTVNAAGGTVAVGSAKGAPSGNVTVTQSAVATGGLPNASSTVTVLGGNNVTVSTTGGSVTVGADGAAAKGAVSVTDTYGGFNVDDITVVGGTTVSVNTTATSGDINIGSVGTTVDAFGKLTNAADYATGNVTVVNATTNGSSTIYGTGDINVTTNGATSVSITGGDGGDIADVQATLAKAGTSTLSSVTLNHVEGPTTITSDALTALTVLNGQVGESYTVVNNTAGHDLAITLGGDATAYPGAVDLIQDVKAGAVTVADNGVASGDVRLNLDSATSVTVNTTAAVNLGIGASGAGTLDNLTAVTLNNTAAIEVFGLENAANLAKVDASGSTGAITIGLDQTATSFTGGSGNDTVVLDNYDLTATNKIVGGSGVNTLVLETSLGTQGTLVAPVDLSTIATNFTNLTLVGENGYFDAKTFTGTLSADDSAVTFENVAAGTTLTVLNGASVDYELKDSSGSNDKATITIGADGTASTGTSVQSASVTATGVEHVTINSEGYVAAGNLNTVTLTDADAKSITLTGDENVAVNTTSGAVSTIDASAATGTVNVTGVEVAASGVSVKGGAGELIASGAPASGSVAQVNTITVGGAYATGDVVTVTVNGTNYSYTVVAGDTPATIANGLAAAITNTSVTVGAVTPVALSTSFSFSLTAKTAGTSFTSTESQTLVSDTGAISAQTTVPNGASQQVDSIAVSGTYLTGDVVTVTINGNAYSHNVVDGDTNAAIVSDLIGKINTGEGAFVTASQGTGTSILVQANAAGVGFTDTVSSSAAAHDGNTSDTVATQNATGGSAVDVFTTGSGGGHITLGTGGSNGGAGSETVNLSASAAVSDEIVAGKGAVAVYNGVAGGVTGFVVSANAQTADHLSIGGLAVTALVNKASAQNVATFVGAALTTQAGAAGNVFANLTFTSVNGVVTFGAVGTHTVSEFTTAQLIAAAQAIVESQSTPTVLEFVSGGNTYVVASTDAGGTLVNSSVTELIGVTGVTGFGSSAAANTIVVDNFVTTAAVSTNGGDAKVATYDETGYSLALLGSGVQTVGTTSTTFANLSASAELDIAAGTYTPVITSQVGASGSNALAIDFAAGTTELKSLTVNGDSSLAIHNAASATIDALVDGTNTVSSITFDGAGSLVVKSIADTALKSFDASAATGSLTLTAAQDGLTIKGSLAGDTITANGAADTISVGDASHAATAGVTLVANGAGDTITLGAADGVVSTIAAAGAGDTINLYGGSNTVVGSFNGLAPLTSLGHGDTINVFGDNSTIDSVWVGSGSTVNLGSTGHSFDGTLNLALQGDVTGATSSGSYSLTTINASLADNAAVNVSFGNATTEALAGGNASGLFGSMVNVASATSLSQALDLAIQQALVLDQTKDAGAHTTVVNGVIELKADTGLISAFEYAGNTYVVEAVNTSKTAAAAHAALGANDVVVQVTGQLSGNASFDGSHTVQAHISAGQHIFA